MTIILSDELKRRVAETVQKERNQPLVDRYVIHWKHKKTGAVGKGGPLLKRTADAWLELLTSSEDADCDYWLEAAEKEGS